LNIINWESFLGEKFLILMDLLDWKSTNACTVYYLLSN
jgi:hypothetical protein